MTDGLARLEKGRQYSVIITEAIFDSKRNKNGGKACLAIRDEVGLMLT
jgi:hypothetical protein